MKKMKIGMVGAPIPAKITMPPGVDMSRDMLSDKGQVLCSSPV